MGQSARSTPAQSTTPEPRDRAPVRPTPPVQESEPALEDTERAARIAQLFDDGTDLGELARVMRERIEEKQLPITLSENPDPEELHRVSLELRRALKKD